MKLLDLFCGAGGASFGYSLAGWEVSGIDIQPQPHYRFPFMRADALGWLESAIISDEIHEFDAVHASPPCQRYANVTKWRGDQIDHPDLVPAVLALLRKADIPWVVENVPGGPLAPDFVLCGTMFGLPIRRHRWFMRSWAEFNQLPQCNHQSSDLPFSHVGERAFADAMECTWMSNYESRQAVPPAYTEWIGKRIP